RLPERRDAVEALHVSFARVVRRDHLRLVAVEAIAQVAEVLRAGADVLRRIREIARAHPPARPRHELHQTDRARARSRRRLELRLRLYDRGDQLGADVVLLRLAVDDRAERHLAVEEVLPHGVGDHAQRLRRFRHRLQRRLRDRLDACGSGADALRDLPRDRLRGPDVPRELAVDRLRGPGGLRLRSAGSGRFLDHFERQTESAEGERRAESPGRTLLPKAAELLPRRDGLHLAPQLRPVVVVEKALAKGPAGLRLTDRHVRSSQLICKRYTMTKLLSRNGLCGDLA